MSSEEAALPQQEAASLLEEGPKEVCHLAVAILEEDHAGKESYQDIDRTRGVLVGTCGNPDHTPPFSH